MASLSKIQAMKIHGNAHDDRALFDEIHNLVMDHNAPMQDKIAALTVLDRATGLRGTIVDEESVQAYIEFFK